MRTELRPASEESTRRRLALGAVLRQSLLDYRLVRATRYGIGPLATIALVGFVQNFDDSIFQLVQPEIRKEFGVSLTVLATAGTIVGFFTLLASPLAGYALDRIKRVTVLGLTTIASGFFSALTGMSNGVKMMAAVRGVNGAGEGLGALPLQSLLADYYPPDVRAKAFALWQFAGRVGGFAAPVITGLLVVRFGWRVAFIISAPLLVATGIFALIKLREPVRGYWERQALGMSEEESTAKEPPIGWGEAVRTIFAIKTLRRLMIAIPISSAGGIAFGFLYGFYLVERFSLNPFERALINVPRNVAGLVGLVVGGVLTDALVRHRPGRVMMIQGLVGLGAAVAHALVIFLPNLGLHVAVNVVIGFTGGVLAPAGVAVFTMVLPPRLRTQGIATILLFAAPSLLIQPVVGYVGTRYGLNPAILLFSPLALVAAALYASAGTFFELDVRAALAAAAAHQEYVRARQSGRTKLLVCRDVDVHYGSIQVLFNVDFDVEEGETIALLGTNGAGKSTLLRAISGVQEASNGAVVFDGRDITHVPPHEISRMGIVHMPGGRGVFPSLTVRENLEMVFDGRPDHARIEQVLGFFPQLRERMDVAAGRLSGGEQQMVALGQAFMTSPRLLVIDELSLGLSPAVVGQLLGIVRAMNEQGTTIILVEQSVNVALTVAERAIFMEKGEVRFVGRTRDLLARPDIMRAVYLKGSAALTSGLRTSTRDVRGRSFGRPILEVEAVTKSYGGVRAVDGVTFALREGEALGLVGPNGAGKTTLFDLISGFSAPDSGRVVLDGNDVTKLGADARARLGLLRRFQTAQLFGSLTVFETLCVALEDRLEVRNTFLNALQIPGARRGEALVRRRADTLVDLLELGAFRDKFVADLSTGVRRVVDLGCVLAAEPKVLLLDEPSSGIAQAEAESLGPLLRRVRYETGCSLLLIEHDMPLICVVADELIGLVQGGIVVRGAPDDVLTHPMLVEAYLGSSEEAMRRSGVLPA